MSEHNAQIIGLPYQLAMPKDVGNCDDIEVLSFQLRIHGVELIRLIQAGQLMPSESVVKILTDINDQLKEFGKPELSLEFLINDIHG